MSTRNKISLAKNKVRTAINSSSTYGAAAILLNLDRRTFKRIAEEYGLYNPINNWSTRKISLKEILEGLHPQYPTSHLSRRLIEEGYKERKCEKCKIEMWNGEYISLELDHIDGNNSNHRLENLRLLCPNCHSQTPTFRFKRGKNGRNPAG